MNNNNHYVHIIEYERGWGSRIEDTIYFSDKESALEYVRKYNEKFNPPLPVNAIPDWYMIAEYGGKID